MDPHIVDKATLPPGQCLFSGDLEGPFIDLGIVAPWVKPYGYLSVSYVEFLARTLLGMVSAEEVEKEVSALEDGLAALGAKAEQLQAFVDATTLAEKLKEGAGI